MPDLINATDRNQREFANFAVIAAKACRIEFHSTKQRDSVHQITRDTLAFRPGRIAWRARARLFFPLSP
jgi:hypothetical protein